MNIWQEYNLGLYLAQFVGGPNQQSIQAIKISIDSNLQPMADVAVFATLLQYLNPFESSVFPMGAQSGIPVSGVPNRSSFTYPIPISLSGFVAMVTISLSPNAAGSATYRIAATYLVSLTTNSDGVHVFDYLAWQPLYPTSSPGVLPLPTIASIQFGEGASPPPPRRCVRTRRVGLSRSPGTATYPGLPFNIRPSRFNPYI